MLTLKKMLEFQCVIINFILRKLIGIPTLNDILAELAKPGRDHREQFAAFQFAAGISKLEDPSPGIQLPGIVTKLLMLMERGYHAGKRQYPVNHTRANPR